MTGLRTLALTVAAILVIAANCTSLDAQATSTGSQSALISASIALENAGDPVGQKPLVVLTIKNVGSREICLSTASSVYRVHVEREDGEAPKTEYHRHLHGEYRPGDRPTLIDGPVICRPVAPGSSYSQRFDPATFYDLSVSGKYTVYLEVRDDSGAWLRTNTAQFEIPGVSRNVKR
jgi:hypothetical protein